MELTLIVTTVVSIVLAAVMGVTLWRQARDERHRSAARVAVLASDLRESESVPALAGELFRTESSDRPRSRLAATLAVGIFAVATALAIVIVTSGGDRSVADPVAAQSLKPAPAADSVPLDLIALGHDRDGDRITVRGIVRNPSAADGADEIAAVVFLFDREGGFLATGRAAIEVPALAPGAESTFVVTVGHAAAVGRYRVSFRSGDLVVPHVDRRNLGPVARADL